MTDINAIQPTGTAKPIDAVAQAAQAGASRPVEAPVPKDVVEISEIARLAAQIQEIPDVRAELVEAVKAQIVAGTYETPERIEIAVQRLTDELLRGL